MLTALHIRHLALVESLDWSLPAGFTAITGETGSGKSIILGALKLVLGERADKALIRTGAEQCSVEAVFHLRDAALLREIDARLAEQGVEPCAEGQLLIKRVFTSSGSNRQFVNCSATTLAVLKSLGENLVDLHGPHDHQSLLDAARQLEVLDSFAASAPLRAQFTAAHRQLTRLQSEHAALSQSEAAMERELDLLRHQVHEIEAASLVGDEGETLLARYTVASNSRRLLELGQRILQRLAEADDSLLSGLAEIQRAFRDLEKIDPETAPIAQSHADAIAALEDVAQSLQRYTAALDLDGEQLAQLEERVTLLETLKRKYGPALADVIAFGDQAAARLRQIESRGDELLRLQSEIAAAEKIVQTLGAKLTAARAKAAPKLAKDIQSQLQQLGFKKSGFQIQLHPLPAPASTGAEHAEFLFAPNPGEPLRALKSIASSGEISRVMLAVKTSLAAQDAIPLLVFDEIDANVGGEIAHAVAAKMHALGLSHQVLVITHLPQVAAAAAAQFVVSKTFAADRTLSALTEVTGPEREEEIARMLGGKSDTALALARTLLRPSVG